MGGGAVPPVGMEGGDWRNQLQHDTRQSIVVKLMETLKRHLPFSGDEGLQELKKIAVRFEEKIYSAATSQSDYLRKISLKMLTMETNSQNPMANSLESNATSTSQNPQDPASLDSSSQTGSTSAADWQEEIYQKIKSMHEMYYPDLNKIYKLATANFANFEQGVINIPPLPMNEHFEKLKCRNIMMALEPLLLFLRKNKKGIQLSDKWKSVGVEKEIVNILNFYRSRMPVSSLQQGQLPQPHLHAMQQSRDQQLLMYQMHSNVGQMNSLVKSMNMRGSMMAAQQNKLTILQQIKQEQQRLRTHDGTHGVASTIFSGNSNVGEQPPELSIKEMNGLDNAYAAEYRALAYHYPQELSTFVHDYRLLWSLAHPFGLTQYEGIFRLVMILPLSWREWAHWVSAQFHISDLVTRRRVSDFGSFYETIYSQIWRVGTPPPGPYEDDPLFPRTPLPNDLPRIHLVVPAPHVQVIVAPPLPFEPEYGTKLPEAELVEAQWMDIEEGAELPRTPLPNDLPGIHLVVPAPQVQVILAPPLPSEPEYGPKLQEVELVEASGWTSRRGLSLLMDPLEAAIDPPVPSPTENGHLENDYTGDEMMEDEPLDEGGN